MSLWSLAWLFLLPVICAFRDTIPVVVWSSHPSSKLDSLAARPTPFAQASHLFEAFLESDDLCRYDGIIIVEQSGLHASDLRTLPESSHVSNRLSNAPSSLQIPYLPHTSGASLDDFKGTLTERCGARRLELALGQGGLDPQQGSKHVVCISMPDLDGDAAQREGALSDSETQLDNELSRLTSLLPSHIIIYTGSRPFTKRQAPEAADFPPRPIIETGFQTQPGLAPINTTLPEGGLFQKYRFFTPGLITALLIVFGLLIPILMVGIYALASIQSPLRMDAPKGPSLEKKNQ